MSHQPPQFSFDIPVPRPRHIQRFARLYKQHYGIALNNTQAARQLTALLVIVRYKIHEMQRNDRKSLPIIYSE